MHRYIQVCTICTTLNVRHRCRRSSCTLMTCHSFRATHPTPCALTAPPIGHNLQASHHVVLMMSFGNWFEFVVLSIITQQSAGKLHALYDIFTKQPNIVTTAPGFQISQLHVGGQTVALRKFPHISINCTGKRSLHDGVAFSIPKTS